MSTTGFANLILFFGSLYLINTNEATYLMLLIRSKPNFEGLLVRVPVLVVNHFGDIGPATFVPVTFVPVSV